MKFQWTDTAKPEDNSEVEINDDIKLAVAFKDLESIKYSASHVEVHFVYEYGDIPTERVIYRRAPE